MIQYIIAAGFGLWLGSQSKKSKKSYAEGGEIPITKLKKYKSIIEKHKAFISFYEDTGEDYDYALEIWIPQYHELVDVYSEQEKDNLIKALNKLNSTYAEGGITEHGLKLGDKIIGYGGKKDEILNVEHRRGQNRVNLETGERTTFGYEKGGKTYAEGGSVKDHKEIPYSSNRREAGSKLFENKNIREKAFRKEKDKFDDSIDDLLPRRYLDELGYAKGGKMQGYDDRLDESLSMRDGAGRKKQQSKKDRRDESAGMEKSMGRRKYASVGTMDKVKTLPKPAKDFIAYVIDMAGNTTLKYSKTFQGANRMMQNMLKKNQDVSTHGVSKYDPFYGTRVGKMFFEPIKGFAKGGMTEHGLEIGDKILGARDTKINVYGEDKDLSMVDLDTGKRTDYAKGGETDFIQQVVDSPDFRKGAFTKKAKSRDLTTEEFMKKVLKNPDKYDERTRKQAQFMKNITS